MLLAFALQLSADATALIGADFRACGIDQSRVLTEYRDDLQDGVAAVSGSTAVSDDQLRCLAQAAAKSGYVVEFADPALGQRFGALYADALVAQGTRYARDRLAAFGLLDRLPVFDPKRESVDAFVSRLETLCGAKPGSVVRRIGPTSLTIDERTFRRAARNRQAERRVECVEAALGATDLKAAGVSFGFLGNEMIDPGPR